MKMDVKHFFLNKSPLTYFLCVYGRTWGRNFYFISPNNSIADT